jgi:hypothetical protein
MTSTKLNEEEKKISSVLQKTILKNFNGYLSTIEYFRDNLINQNNLLKNKFKQSFKEERDYLNINGPSIYDRDVFSIDVINENFYSDNICITNSENVPKGIFCYPINRNYRPEDNLSKTYMMKFNNYGTYDFVLSNTYKSLINKFVILPNTRNDEIVLNKEFIIWTFCLIIKKLNSNEKLNFEKTCHIIKRIAEFFNKKFECIYKIISHFLSNYIFHKNKKTSNTNLSSIKKYREYYCQICYEYSCKLHYYTSKEIISIDSLKDAKGKQIKFCRTKFKKLCPLIQFTISNKEKLIRNNSTSCADLGLNLNCWKTSGKSFEKNDDHFQTLVKYFNLNFSCIEIYILSLLFASEIMIHPCSLKNNVFYGNSRITCNLLFKIYNIFNFDKFIFYSAVDNFIKIQNNDIPLTNFTIRKEIIKVIEIKKISPSNRNKFQHSRIIYDYSPCVHEGSCNKSNCSCMKSRGYCEKFCSCRSYCDNLFKGCECTNGCKMSDDENNSNCLCVSNGRECDPDLCHKQSENTFNYAQNLCSYNNMNISYHRFKKICLAKSVIIDHYGVFALDNIEPHELICEYTGEVINKKETERRYVFFDWIDMNYIFGLSKESDIDAFKFVSKMRYVNHSSHGYENAYARIKYVRGNYRIGLYALRYINSGEEILFDYRIQYGQPYWLIRYNNQYGKN